MSKVTVKDATSKKTWDDFIKSHQEANFLQSWDFYEFHRARGKKIVRRMVYQGEKISGAYAGVVETAKRGKYMAIAGGPIVSWDDTDIIYMVFFENEILSLFIYFRKESQTIEHCDKVIIFDFFEQRVFRYLLQRFV